MLTMMLKLWPAETLVLTWHHLYQHHHADLARIPETLYPKFAVVLQLLSSNADLLVEQSLSASTGCAAGPNTPPNP
jgi:hypothetical protein